MATDAEIAWAAGLFEGEGCFRFTGPRVGKSRVAMLTIQMTDRDTMKRFRDAVDAGRLRGPQDRGPGRKPIYAVDIAAREDVQRIIGAFLPWLGERRAAKARELLAHTQTLDEEAATRSEFCKRGHPRTPENVYTMPNGYGVCRTCKRDAGREWMREKRRKDPAFAQRQREASRAYARRKRAGAKPAS